jgi:hypothetical protein
LNIIVALSTGVLSGGYAYSNAIDSWLIYGFFSFFSTLAVYNGQRLFKAKSFEQTPWLKWVDENRSGLLILSVTSGIGACATLLLLPKIEHVTMVLLGWSGLISTLYVLKIKGMNMRQIPHLKIHLIAISWVAVVIVFPAVNESKEEALVWPAVAHYIYVLAVTIPFDIRDLKHDIPEQRTIPQVVGVRGSKFISIVLLLCFPITMLYFVEPFLLLNPWFFISIFVQIVLVLFMNEKRSDIYCAGMIDGSIALLGLSYFLC